MDGKKEGRNREKETYKITRYTGRESCGWRRVSPH